MPQVTTIISGVASLGVLAGVVSGIFYLVLTGIRWAGRVRAALKEEEERKNATQCVACGRAFSASAASQVVCTICGKRACFDLPCSRSAPLGWNCVVCHIKRNLDSSSGSSLTDAKSEEDKPESNSDIDGETVKVRDFIEKIVEKIVGGSLDGVTVGKLTSHLEYDEMFTQYHEQLCQALARLGFALQLSLSSKNQVQDETSSSAHTTLIRLIEKLADDAAKLPNLREGGRKIKNKNERGTSIIAEKSYEDILSTAILNKVIEKYQQENGYFHKSAKNHQENLLDDDESDWSDNSRSDPVALKIEEHIEEVTASYGSSSDDLEDDFSTEAVVQNRRVPFPEYGVDIIEDEEINDVSDSESCATDVLSSHSTWEENWLFQRKKLKLGRGGHHPVPVPMLVPNPSQEFRALIGGVDADDISDLSECSDSALEEVMSETTDEPKNALRIIDALNQESASEDEINNFDSCSKPVTVVKSVSEDLTEGSHSSDTAISQDSLEVAPEISISVSPTPSLGQQDRDVPVDYDIVAQIDCPPVPKPRTLDKEECLEKENEIEEPSLVCPIAEREKAKWNNAIEMKDNPYTPESIAKRINNQKFLQLNGKSSTDFVDFPVELGEIEEPEPEVSTKMYSRDYYIKASKSPTGGISTRSSGSPVSLRSEASIEEGEDSLVIHRIVEQYKKPAVLKRQVAVESLPAELPNVEDLKKKFLAKPPIPVRAKPVSHSEPPKEPDIDYSLTPVSEIITNLKNLSAIKPEPSNKKDEIFHEVSKIRRESLTKCKEEDPATSRQSETTPTENGEIADILTQFPLPKVKKPIKPVHSLTARSIPKDFREGLKNSVHLAKLSKAATVGDVVYSGSENTSLPPLNFDVKNKKKFWENIAKEQK